MATLRKEHDRAERRLRAALAAQRRVFVRGALAEVTDPGDLERLRALPLYPWAPGDKSRYLRVRAASVTGRRIRIPDDLPFTWWG